jgi:hypothetical protein
MSRYRDCVCAGACVGHHQGRWQDQDASDQCTVHPERLGGPWQAKGCVPWVQMWHYQPVYWDAAAAWPILLTHIHTPTRGTLTSVYSCEGKKAQMRHDGKRCGRSMAGTTHVVCYKLGMQGGRILIVGFKRGCGGFDFVCQRANVSTPRLCSISRS